MMDTTTFLAAIPAIIGSIFFICHNLKGFRQSVKEERKMKRLGYVYEYIDGKGVWKKHGPEPHSERSTKDS